MELVLGQKFDNHWSSTKFIWTTSPDRYPELSGSTPLGVAFPALEIVIHFEMYLNLLCIEVSKSLRKWKTAKRFSRQFILLPLALHPN